MNKYSDLLKKIKIMAKKKHKNDFAGHDYWHLYRVANLAKYIAIKEEANVLIVEFSAWLHDIIHSPDKDHELRSARFAEKFLKGKLESNIVTHIVNCVKNHRFSKGIKPKTLEEKIVQDADKLDALGAIGLSRLFVLSRHYNQIVHNPYTKPDFDFYLRTGYSTTTINHFYDKLFKLRKLMHTKTAKEIAIKRENFMKDFLKRFYLEWEGKQ